jgi:hypothetical protein
MQRIYTNRLLNTVHIHTVFSTEAGLRPTLKHIFFNWFCGGVLRLLVPSGSSTLIIVERSFNAHAVLTPLLFNPAFQGITTYPPGNVLSPAQYNNSITTYPPGNVLSPAQYNNSITTYPPGNVLSPAPYNNSTTTVQQHTHQGTICPQQHNNIPTRERAIPCTV